MTNDTLSPERLQALSAELTSQGADIRRLGFLRWLAQNGHHPEGVEPADDQAGGEAAGYPLERELSGLSPSTVAGKP